MAADVIPLTMNPELVAACNALGYREGDKYMKEPYCLETIKDLIRYLRREDDTCDIRRQLGAAQILQNDLIPIVIQYNRQTELMETCLRLMVNLTQPVDLCFTKPENKGDKVYQSYALEILSHQQSYKEAFGDEEFMACLASKLKKLLEKPWEKRREDDSLLMERILVLIRNILHVPADPAGEKRTDDDVSVHDAVLWGMNTSGLDKLILYIASSEGEQHWCIHAAEIISRMLREQSPEFIARAGKGTASNEKKKEIAELEALRMKEREQRKVRQHKLSSRHSRFGGTFQVKNLKSISDYDVIYHRTLPKDVNSISFALDKAPPKRPRHRLPMQDMTVTRRSTLSMRLFLKDFCSLFLENCYNPMMYNVKDHILHQRAQENDDSYYLWIMRFFMEFNRLHDFQVDQISETFSIQTFHYVQMQILKYLEMLTTDKMEMKNWARRLHIALRAYRELLLTLDAISSHPDETVRESSHVIQSNVFYVIEYREVLLILLKTYTDIKNTRKSQANVVPKVPNLGVWMDQHITFIATSSRTFLTDLVDTTHLYLKMLEKYCKGKKNIIVQKKAKKKAKRRKRKQTTDQSQTAEAREMALNESWDNIAGDLSAMLQDREDIPDNVIPFDAASEQPIEEQRSDAMIRIQTCLHNGQGGDAIALLRAAREVWPDGDAFGASDIAPEDEFMALREIHFTNLHVTEEAPNATAEELMEDEVDDEEENELAEENPARAEEEFNFILYVNQFSHVEILKNYVHLLENFRSNSQHINHCIIKMLHRISVDCDKVPKLFQLSLFYVFHQLFNDPLAKCNQYKEMVKFGHFLMKKFFEAAPKNPKIFMELFFWKDNKEIFELSEGYGAVRRQGDGITDEWDDSLKEELRELFGRFNEVEGEKDTVDHIMEHISDESKTRKQIIRQMVDLQLIENFGDMKRAKGTKKVTLWREEQVDELKELFSDYKDSEDIMGNIISAMIKPRPRAQVVQKLLELNLITDKKDVRKKRPKGQGRRQRGKATEEEPFIEEEEPRFEGREANAENGGREQKDKEDEGIYELPSDESEAEESGMDHSDDSESDGDDDDDDDEEPTKENMKLMIDKLQKKGFRDQILWIQEGLKVRADDKENDEKDQEAVPIVPLEERCSHAMGNKLFQKFLHRLGMNPPSDHQETFWRIPGSLSFKALRERAAAIEPGKESDSLKKQRERHRMLEEMAYKQKEKKKSRRTRKKVFTADEVIEKISVLENMEDEDQGEDDEESLKEKERRKKPSSILRVKRPLDSESSSGESDNEPLGDLLTKGKRPTDLHPAKRSRVALESDDSEEEQNVTEETINDNKEGNNTRRENKGEQKASQRSSKNRSVLDSDDSDSDEDVPVGVLVQRRVALIESEEDSDGD